MVTEFSFWWFIEKKTTQVTQASKGAVVPLRINIYMWLFKGHPHLMTRFDVGHHIPHHGNWHLSTIADWDMQIRSCCQNSRMVQNHEAYHLVTDRKFVDLPTGEHTHTQKHTCQKKKNFFQTRIPLVFCLVLRKLKTMSISIIVDIWYN